jgi:deoxyribodipyrimidine photolyase
MSDLNKSIFIFRRDFCLEDNIGFIECYKKSDKILPIFIFTPEQIINNPYKSSNAIQFMIDSLKDLELSYKEKGIKLLYFLGKTEDVLEELVEETKTWTE